MTHGKELFYALYQLNLLRVYVDVKDQNEEHIGTQIYMYMEFLMSSFVRIK